MRKSAKILVYGLVQGIGFRPFVHRFANQYHLAGWVKNTSMGVEIFVEGEENDIERFYADLPEKAPPLADIIKMEISYNHYEKLPFTDFRVLKSDPSAEKTTIISPDIGTCAECLKEMRDLCDRRYGYPFLNCTNCGPRFTILKTIPYDRQNTSMEKFKMCLSCQREYDDINNRRYHAQPNACAICGPHLKLYKDKNEIKTESIIKEAIDRLARGEIIAIKGLGGFHLACDALNPSAVRALRKRKKREQGKPFAIMVRDIETATDFCYVNETERKLLQSQRAPIVLLEKRPNCPVAEEVAPNNKFLGIMLPYTPLHHLIMDGPYKALVMTSGNTSEEPLIADNQEAIEQLGDIANAILIHNREIINRCDDSVVRVRGEKMIPIRRSRGFAPLPIIMERDLPAILAVGAELKNTFALTKKNMIFLSQHIGDLKNYKTYQFFKEAITRLKGFFEIEPEIVAYDLHPQYLSTIYAQSLKAKNKIGIQHHHAHIASCMAENHLEGKVIGVAMDGTGYGSDRTIWGGEFLVTDYLKFNRVGYFHPVSLPGGDLAIKEPYRMAISYLYHSFGEEFIDLFPKLVERWGYDKVKLILKMIKQNINCPLTSSSGRIFDAVSSIIGICDFSTYEARASIELEMVADPKESGSYPYQITEQGDRFIIDIKETIISIMQDLKKGVSIAAISAKFHLTMIDIIVKMCEKISRISGIERLVLSGGVFQNIFMTDRLISQLEKSGFEVFSHTIVPTNDGGIALGQAIIASEVMRKCV